VIDSRYTHVIVDEAHELSAPMLAVLDRSPQSIIALGDELQNLNGLSPMAASSASAASTIRCAPGRQWTTCSTR
jgi:hypothetical protein